MARSSRWNRVLMGGLLVALPALAPPARNRAQDAASAEPRGPGVAGPGVLDLALDRARSSDLSHVEPEFFAAALQRDPHRIFEFLRDRVAYENYPGLLRGPRGTLLAMAGNSVDRASLLAAMLRSAGRRVRFASGRLPEERAAALARSIWSERAAAFPEPAHAERAPGLAKFAELLRARVEFEFGLIRAALGDAGVTAPDPGTRTPPSVEGPAHFWVQLEEQEQWIDLDPSFADSSFGQPHAKAERTCDALPDSLTTRIELTLRLEEHAGDQSSTRELLRFSATAAELSGRGLFLVHLPEHWKGPSASLSDSLAQVIEESGRIKPVLVAGDRWVAGESFRQQPPATTGLSGVRVLLGGASRKETPVATAEFLEIEITGADGRTETVVRELFDRIGAGRRAAGTPLAAAEIKAALERATDASEVFHDLFFTTGRIDPAHFAGIAPPADERATTPASEAAESDATHPLQVSELLRKVNLALATAADALMGRVEDGAGGTVVFYPDSPRIQIVDLRRSDDSERLTLDLRRTRLIGRPDPKAARFAFEAQLLRGIFEGVLERTLCEFLSSRSDASGAGSFSTSAFIERAHADGLPITSLRSADLDRLAHVPHDGRARLKSSVEEGRIAICPTAPVSCDGTPRFAWWQLDPRSGELVAMTDEGLHGSSGENKIVLAVVTKGPTGMTVTVQIWVMSVGRGFVPLTTTGVYQVLDEGGVFDLMRALGYGCWSALMPR